MHRSINDRSDNIDELVRVLRNFNNCEPSQKDESITAIYGMAAKIPDKGIVTYSKPEILPSLRGIKPNLLAVCSGIKPEVVSNSKPKVKSEAILG